MAEAGLFSLAANLLSALASLASKKGHERAHVAKGDIGKLETSVKTIQAVVLDAEKQQESSAAVKGWIRVVRNAFYDADDLFDEILTYGEVNQPTEGSKFQIQVRDFFSPSNTLAYAYKVRARVKALSKSLDLASKEIKMFCFVQRQHEEPVPDVVKDRCEGSFVDSERVIGRNAEEKDILDFLLNESWDEKMNVPVFAVVGIGGMGKTTLARLVYDNDLVKEKFSKKWWACISDTDEDTEILRRICKAIAYGRTHDLDARPLKSRIKESIGNAGKYLLVIDDVWDDNHVKWSERMKLLHNGCEGCRIIVTTRSPLVARAMEAVKTHMLRGLSENDSWQLFKMIAFIREEGDERWTSLRRGIVNVCLGVPLAITLIAGLLYTIGKEQWKSFMDEEISKIELSDKVVMSALKLSYDRLPSALKQCFAYCASFPKDIIISKQKLLCLWIAQGYITSQTDGQTVEERGDAYLKQLLSISFLMEAEQHEASEIEHYKMHDSVHDFAQLVAGDQVAVLTTEHCSIPRRSARHAFVGNGMFQSFETLPELLSMDRLRSCIFTTADSQRLPVIRQQLTMFRHLRALELSELGIEDVPGCIGDFKYLRYLNLSRNNFRTLPDSISKLFNLLSLDVSWCVRLKAWPKDLRRLIKLRHLEYSHCPGLTQMPDGFGELTHLQYLSDFKPGVDGSLLGAFSNLALKGKLTIEFAEDYAQQNDDDRWQLPITVVVLRICSYLGTSLPRWRDERTATIVYLELQCCENLKRLPDLSILRNLKTMVVYRANVLEYVEEEETTSSLSPSFPCLENLSLIQLPELKGWSRTALRLNGSSSPRLNKLVILECPGMGLWGDANKGMEWDSLSTLRTLKILPMPMREELPHCLLRPNLKIWGLYPNELPLQENNY